ncbi:MAG: hypothetical protein LBK77_04005 [Spirochaetaceae bacterium]|jgi:hypothetical protein|nr:hypothetical protein [Spirochaetaceae bacterium]
MNRYLSCIVLRFFLAAAVLVSARNLAAQTAQVTQASPAAQAVTQEVTQAAELEAFLKVPVVSRAQAARFIAASAPSPGTAEEGWLSKKTEPDDPVNMGELSFLLMRAFNIKGGLMYTLLPGPRYAFRTMVSRSLIQGSADPAMTVSGERFLQILGNVLNLAEREDP